MNAKRATPRPRIMTKTEIIFRFVDSCFPEAVTAREIAESFTAIDWPMTVNSVRCLLAQDYKRFCKIDKGLWAIRYEGNYPSTPYEVAEVSKARTHR